MTVHAAIESVASLHVNVDSHDLEAMAVRGSTAEVASHDLSAATRCHHLKAVAFA